MWSLPSGSANAMLITSGCTATQNDTYSEVFTFELEMTGPTAEISVNVLSSGTVASDSYGNTATTSMNNIGTYALAGNGNTGPTGASTPPPTNPTPTNPTISTQGSNPPTSTSPTIPQYPGIPAVTAEVPFSPVYLLIGVVVIIAIVGFTGFYAGSRKNPLKDAQREWEKQRHGKNTKWNKED
jgi:hypothetical protein